MRPRNTLVTIAPIKQEEKKVGGIVVPGSTSQQYQQAEVISVGPGMITEEGELSPCRDLQPGQIVLVHVKRQQRTGAYASLEPLGLEYKTDDGRDMVLVDQTQIVGIIQDPDDKLTLTE